MKLDYLDLHSCPDETSLLEHVRDAASPEPALISGAHQMLMQNGTINTFGDFARRTGDLAAGLREILDASKLFIQINDQLDFQGIAEGKIPHEGKSFWDNPWEYLQEDGHTPEWSPEHLLEGGLDIHGTPTTGLVSEWQLQRMHHVSGLRSAHWANAKSTKRKVLEVVHEAIPRAAMEGASCRASGCAHEIMVEGPFSVQRGYRQLIGFWPQACKGPVLFGSTLAAQSMERTLKTRLPDLNFEGPFRYVHVFLNTENPRSFKELVDQACLASVTADTPL